MLSINLIQIVELNAVSLVTEPDKVLKCSSLVQSLEFLFQCIEASYNDSFRNTDLIQHALITFPLHCHYPLINCIRKCFSLFQDSVQNYNIPFLLIWKYWALGFFYVKDKKGKNYPCNRPWRPIGLWDVEAATVSRPSAHRWRWT
jgi:hypothetical protein